MNKAFELIGYGKQVSDCTSEYILKLDNDVFVRNVIRQILSNETEWGYIGIKTNINNEGYGAHHFEYRYGKIKEETMSENEKYFWKSIEHYKVIGITGSGGWTRSDYQIEIQSR